MEAKTQIIFTLTLLLLVIMFIHHAQKEQFTSKAAKADAIYDWFLNRATHTFTDYKKKLKRSNIVEFEDALRLYQQRDFTRESIARIL